MAPEEAKPAQLAEMLSRLEEQVREMRDDLETGLSAIVGALELRRADDEAETLAAERIRSGAADRVRDGNEALAELGIETH